MSTDGQPRRNHLNHKEHEAHQRPHKDDLGSDSPGLFRPGFANRYGEEMGWFKMKLCGFLVSLVLLVVQIRIPKT